mmetsp:Transcript_55023/g.130159  ORF Transcript_55023/g.130159 Transcript_55023/m.130159 type:complete len:164 (-) Transcript_55023:73-564(-)
MANQAEKKATLRVRDFRQYHGGALLVVFLIYAAFRFGLYSVGWERMHTIAFSVSTVVQYICYSVIFSHLEGGGLLDDKGGFVSPCRDILYLLIFSQTVSLYSEWAWCTMGIVPVVGTYQFVTGIIIPFILGGGERDEGYDNSMSKTQAKKAKRQEKFGGGSGR